MEKHKLMIQPKHVFYFFSMNGIILFFILCIFKRQYMFQWLAMENRSVSMFDYFNLILHTKVRKNMYSILGTYSPPFAYTFFLFFRWITTTGTLPNGTEIQVASQPYQMMWFLMYLVTGIFILIQAINEIKLDDIEKNLIIMTILFSSPFFAGAIERANIILYVIAFLLLASFWKDSEDKWKREASLLLIAISAGIKIYPAVFGLLYLRERKWKEAVRLIIYGAAVFFVPFTLFGGISEVTQYFKILFELMNNDYTGKFRFIKGLLNFVGVYGWLATVGTLIFTGSLVLGILLSKNNLRRLIYIASFMALVPGNAYRYSLAFFLIPTIMLLGERKELYTWEEYIDAGLFGMIFTIPTIFGIITNFKLQNEIYSYTYVDLRLYFAAWVLVFFTFACDMQSWFKGKNLKIKE